MFIQKLSFCMGVLFISAGLMLMNCVDSEDNQPATSIVNQSSGDTFTTYSADSGCCGSTSSISSIPGVTTTTTTTTTSSGCPVWTGVPIGTLISPASASVFTTGASIELDATIHGYAISPECPFYGTATFVISTTPTFTSPATIVEEQSYWFSVPTHTVTVTHSVSPTLTANTGTYYWYAYADYWKPYYTSNQPFSFVIQ